MIRRLAWLHLLLVLTAFGSGCVSSHRESGMTILFIPVYDDAHPMMPGAGAGNGNDDLHWFSDPDSHPAVRPRRAAQPAAQPAAPSSAGARVESYAPPGGGTGVAQMAADGWHRG